MRYAPRIQLDGWEEPIATPHKKTSSTILQSNLPETNAPTNVDLALPGPNPIIVRHWKQIYIEQLDSIGEPREALVFDVLNHDLNATT